VYEGWDNKKALEYYDRSRMLFHQAGDQIGEAVAINNIGKTYTVLGNHQQALTHAEQAVSMLKAIGNLNFRVIALDHLAVVLANLGRSKDAVARYKEAADTALQRNPPDAQSATRSLDRALGLALRHGFLQDASSVLEALQTQGLPDAEVTLRRAR